ncbi:TPA: DUF551 domain-containing protein [Escherichia coli]|nr:DUF551 domain-containing protein [Escherichia coli]HBB0093625.1 DUF551 domain-containing protein [Escherichia coli]HBB0117232.1 DUF551 domain-containing protein [Escherichia coli]
MTTITDKKQYPSDQYLNELITNMEFAARAPVEVVRVMAAELQKRREADSAEPVSQTYKLTFEQWLEQQHDKIDVDCGCVSTEMLMHWIRVAYEAGNYPVTPDGWISCSERMPVIGELNWRTGFPLLITCEIGVIPAYYGFVSVNGDKHYGFMESFKYGDDRGGHPKTNEYGLISNVTHWMPLPEPPQEVNRG